jgi:hypothetical protein
METILPRDAWERRRPRRPTYFGEAGGKLYRRPYSAFGQDHACLTTRQELPEFVSGLLGKIGWPPTHAADQIGCPTEGYFLLQGSKQLDRLSHDLRFRLRLAPGQSIQGLFGFGVESYAGGQ